jgi:transposase
MPRTRPAYPREFREQLLALVHSGRDPESLSREFGCSATTIRNWLKRADLDAGVRTDDLTTDERTELVRLRRENRVLREEREILKKAAAWFARETGSVPSKGTDS